jgi:two-component system CheB/CheR fusion protein
MPKAAVETGAVDLVLPADKMADAMIRFVADGVRGCPHEAQDATESGGEDAMHSVFGLLHSECGIDFSWYKKTTVRRRIERRLQMLRSPDLDDYVQRLQTDAEERDQLYKDLLIGVTRFFRDADAFNIVARAQARARAGLCRPWSISPP